MVRGINDTMYDVYRGQQKKFGALAGDLLSSTLPMWSGCISACVNFLPKLSNGEINDAEQGEKLCEMAIATSLVIYYIVEEYYPKLAESNLEGAGNIIKMAQNTFTGLMNLSIKCNCYINLRGTDLKK